MVEMSGPDPEETEMAAAVAAAMGGRAVAHDDGSGPSMYDFKIETPGQRIALEITTVVDPDHLQFSDMVTKHAHRGTLRRLWDVEPDCSRTDPKAFFDKEIGLLAELEDRGVEEFDGRLSRNGADPTIESLWQVHGICTGTSFDNDDDGWVVFTSRCRLRRKG